jgi:hypothetical protein
MALDSFVALTDVYAQMKRDWLRVISNKKAKLWPLVERRSKTSASP